MTNNPKCLFITNDEFDANFSRKPFLSWLLINKALRSDLLYPSNTTEDKVVNPNGRTDYFFEKRGVSFSNFLRVHKIVKKSSFDLIIARGIENIFLWSLVSLFLTKKYKSIFFITGLGRLFDNKNPAYIKYFYKLLIRFLKFLHKATIIVQNIDDANELNLPLTSIVNGSGYNQKNNLLTKDLKTINIVTSSRLNESKGIDEMLRFAECIVSSNMRNINYYIFGDYSKLSSVIQKQILKLNTSPNIFFEGFNHSIESLLSVSHFAFLPSKYREGSPRFLIESISNGLIPITTNEPGCKSFLKHGLLYIDPKDTLFQINKLITENTYNSLSQKNYDFFKTIYSSEIVYEKYFDIINFKLNN
mgnify:CR=1 FL=1